MPNEIERQQDVVEAGRLRREHRAEQGLAAHHRPKRLPVDAFVVVADPDIENRDRRDDESDADDDDDGPRQPRRRGEPPERTPRHHDSDSQGSAGCGNLINVMGKLIYSAITSLDGYVADERGNFDWAAPDDEVHRFVNDLERPVGTYLYGRRMYDVMRYWETAHTISDQPRVMLDFAQIWQSADKVVYSKTLKTASSARTRIEPDFDPAAVRRMKAAATKDISVGGPHLAAEAIQPGLVDELQLFVTPVVVGGGNRALPDGVRVNLELLEERRFANGTVFLHYKLIAPKRDDSPS